MPGFGQNPPNDSAVTPYRKTKLLVDVPEWEMHWVPWSLPRRADQISRNDSSGHGRNTNVLYWPQLGWGLRPLQYDNKFEQTVLQAACLAASAYTLAADIVEKAMHSATALTGVVYDGLVEASGDKFLQKTIGAGLSYAQSLAADAAGYPAPTLDSANAPMVRVAVGKSTYPPNQGWHLRLSAPPYRFASTDVIHTFYHGGPASQPTAAGGAPPGPTLTNPGGGFAHAFKGNGKANLWELIGTAWAHRGEYTWSHNPLAGAVHSISIAMSGKHLSVLSSVSQAPPAGPSVIQSRAQAVPPAPPVLHFSPAPFSLGPTLGSPPPPKKSTAAGAGPPRHDMRVDQHVKFQASTLLYPASGTLVDLPFSIETKIPAGVPFTMKITADTPSGTAITFKIYDATTNVELSQVSGQYVSNAGQQSYYVVFTLTTSDSNVTPWLKKYEVSIQGNRSLGTQTPFTGGWVQDVSITGATTDPKTESAHMSIEDPKNELARLQDRGAYRCQIVTQYDSVDSSLLSVLFEGELANAPATKRGKLKNAGFAQTGSLVQYPSKDWHHYGLDFTPLVARQADQLSFMIKDFAQSDKGEFDLSDPAHPVPLPWKITDMLSFLLQLTGEDPADLDIPDLPIRAFTSGEDSEYYLQPMAVLMDMAQTFARDYLGGILFRDHNAGPRGMWRFILPPVNPAPIYNFYESYPTSVGAKVYTKPGAYGANSTFCMDITKRIIRPQNNFVVVIGGGSVLPGAGGPSIVMQRAFNGKSFNFDPAHPTATDRSHPDFIGRFAPLIRFDQTLSGQKSVDWVTRRLFDQTCVHKRWVEFHAPLVLVPQSVTGDARQSRPRPLRTYDAVTWYDESYTPRTVILQSVNPAWSKDSMQAAYYQGLVVD